MGVLFMATADMQTIVGFWSYYSGSVSTETSPAPITGTHCFKLRNSATSDSNMRHYLDPGISEGYLKFACHSNQDTNSVTLYGDSNYQLAIRINSSGFHFYRGSYAGTLLDSVTMTTNLWNVVEWHWIISDTVGVFQVKINGIMVFDYSGDTRSDTSTEEVREVWFTTYDSYSGTGYYDDIVIRDDDWPGRGGVYVLVPNSGSATEDWTASAGDPEDCVDELPVDTADYISSPHTPSGVQHLFNIEDLPSDGDVNALAIMSYSTMVPAGDGYSRNIVRSDSITGSGERVGVTGTGGWQLDCFDTNPATASGWTVAEINALEIGVET